MTESDLTPLASGNHEAFVVDASWTAGDTPAFALCLTIIAGVHKGDVVELTIETGTAAYRGALAAFYLDETAPGDETATTHVIGLPVELVVARDGGRVGYGLRRA